MKRIYFFNGWGMEDTILSNISNSTDFEIEAINFPYELDEKELQKQDQNIFIAWSFGVYYLNKFLNTTHILNSKKIKSIAINGLPETIGKYGINKKIFDLTLETLNEENLLKFYINMDIDRNFKRSKKKFEDIKNELKYFKENYKIFPNKIDYFLIGKYDRIILANKQEKFCQENGIDYSMFEFGHYPFSYFKDFKEIIEFIKK